VRIQARGDDDAWQRFLRLATPLLEYWAERLGLGQHDAQDLVREAFTVVPEKMPGFSYDHNKSLTPPALDVDLALPSTTAAAANTLGALTFQPT
jgi:hypothetical protein